MSRFRAALVAVGAVGATLLTGACAAGQHAATAEEKPTFDGTNGQIGNIELDGVVFRSPSGTSYPKGASVPLTVYLVNNGDSADKLVRVSSSAFPGGWDAVSTPSLLAGPSGAASAPASNKPVSGHPIEIPANSAVGYGLQSLSPSGAGSPESLVLLGLTKQLYPASAVPVTFTFANAGQTTLQVPVAITNSPGGETVPPVSDSPAA